MDIRPLTPRYSVAPQIEPSDFAAIAAAGYTTVINNRPCMEVPPSHNAQSMQAAAAAAGLEFVVLPITHQSLNVDAVAAQRAAVEAANGPVLAYCASGTRSTIIWALGQAGHMATDDIIAAAGAHGYDLSKMRGQLDALADGQSDLP